MLKTIILIGGPQKGTRFRPLSLELPKPLFPVAGFPMIYHHIEAASKVPEMREIILIGSYQPNEALNSFITNVQREFKILVRYFGCIASKVPQGKLLAYSQLGTERVNLISCIYNIEILSGDGNSRYLQEYTALGTAGGMYHFRDQILSGNPELFFVMNADVCGDFPLVDMLEFHKERANGTHCTIMGTEATRQQSLMYGCIVENKDTHEVTHYVEKPETFVSSTINCGIYLFCPDIFTHIATAFQENQDAYCLYANGSYAGSRETIRLEQEIFVPLAGSGKLLVYHTNRFWSQIKSAGAAVYANRHYLSIYRRTHPERLAINSDGKPKIVGDVFIHPTASVHPSATLGPNVTIGKNVTVGPGVRVRESMVLEGAVLQDHCCILHSIVGWHCTVGQWSRVEGTPNDPNPNKPFAKLDIPNLFNTDGRLNPSITVIGSGVQIPGEVIVLNSIVLPHKELSGSHKNQIIL